MGIRSLLLLDEGELANVPLRHTPNGMTDDLLEGGVGVGVVEPHLGQGQAQLLVRLPHLPIVRLQQRDRPGQDPIAQRSPVVLPRAVKLEREILLVGPHLKGPLFAELDGKCELATHQTRDLLEQKVLRARLGRKGTQASGVFLLHSNEIRVGFDDLDGRPKELGDRGQQVGFGILGLQRDRLLVLRGVHTVLAIEVALRPQLFGQLALLPRVEHGKRDLLPIRLLLPPLLRFLRGLHEGVVLRLALRTPRVPDVDDDSGELRQSLVEVLRSEPN
mmetsp:Transcript_66233/g.167885  ORF Transcript_66233/g.167885 Transcript_66233/m.167885 type:complete len:275 (+) Transcript_66233:760-1584(+)